MWESIRYGRWIEAGGTGMGEWERGWGNGNRAGETGMGERGWGSRNGAGGMGLLASPQHIPACCTTPNMEWDRWERSGTGEGTGLRMGLGTE